MAGCIGGMLSIAATNIHLHISVPERRWFRIRKVTGGPKAAIVSSDGKDCDVRIADLRFGERRDLLVEVEMSSPGYGDEYHEQQQREQQARDPGLNTATDAFFMSKVGLNPATFEESSFYEDEYDGMPDDVPLFEVSSPFQTGFPACMRLISFLHSGERGVP